MKKYNIKVNGQSYEVEIEEVNSSVTTKSAPVVETRPVQKVETPVAKVEVKKEAVKASEGSSVIESPMPGTILDILVNVGDSVEVNQTLLVLEAMKMENNIVSPISGVVSKIHVTKNSTVNAGELMIEIG